MVMEDLILAKERSAAALIPESPPAKLLLCTSRSALAMCSSRTLGLALLLLQPTHHPSERDNGVRQSVTHAANGKIAGLCGNRHSRALEVCQRLDGTSRRLWDVGAAHFSSASGEGVSGTVIWLPMGASGSLWLRGSSADSSSGALGSPTMAASANSLVPACIVHSRFSHA